MPRGTGRSRTYIHSYAFSCIREDVFSGLTPSHIENAHSIDFGDYDIVVYLEKNHSFITLFLQSDKYTFRKIGVLNVKRCNNIIISYTIHFTRNLLTTVFYKSNTFIILFESVLIIISFCASKGLLIIRGGKGPVCQRLLLYI